MGIAAYAVAQELEGDNYYHFGARYYIPTNTRWTQAKPKTGNINNPATLLTYGYAGDDPVNQTDVNGQSIDNLSTGEKVGWASLQSELEPPSWDLELQA